MAENEKTRKSLSDERDRLMERRGADERNFMPELVLDTNSAAKEREELRKTTPVNRSHSAYRSGQDVRAYLLGRLTKGLTGQSSPAGVL